MTTALRILAHGRGWVAIDKPSGVSVHNDPEGRADLLGLARAYLLENKGLAAECDWDPAFAPAPAHRLDRETSGVILLALRRESARELQRLFEDRATKKTYRAVVRGRLDSPHGEWSHPLTDKAEGRKNPAGRAAERSPCLTRYQTARDNTYITELEVDLGTGRQHQIRKHAAIAGHAIVGDGRYGDPKYNAMIARRFGLERMLLHAWRLSIPSLSLAIEAPVPFEFNKVFGPTPPGTEK